MKWISFRVFRWRFAPLCAVPILHLLKPILEAIRASP